ncbi:MAG: CPBP family intramembrane metalloprotease [Muribaculaceae bacterium]|nr:CPBP family intramembrane metalloprotease [Muribaculaceae bacterium]
MTDTPDNKDFWTRASDKGEFPMTLRTGAALGLLLCFFILCYVVTAVTVLVAGRLCEGNPAAGLRIGAMLQDVLLFVVPAVGTALIATRYPAQLLCIMHRPKLLPMMFVLAILLVSVPAQEAVIYWNYHWDWLPETLDRLARAMETEAAATIGVMMDDTSVPGLILNILIVGVAAGFSEELLFRGAFLRILMRSRLNVHVCVWIVAFVFSAMHFQLFGFVPRMLLGAYFGYLLVWTRSLWVPVAAHVLNNTTYVVTAWLQARQGGTSATESVPELWSLPVTVASVVLTAALLYVLWRFCRESADSE